MNWRRILIFGYSLNNKIYFWKIWSRIIHYSFIYIKHHSIGYGYELNFPRFRYFCWVFNFSNLKSCTKFTVKHIKRYNNIHLAKDFVLLFSYLLNQAARNTSISYIEANSSHDSHFHGTRHGKDVYCLG